MASETSMKRLNKVVGHLQPPAAPLDFKPCANNSFEYTMPDGILSTEQRRFYEENGFLVIKNLLTPGEVATFYNRFDELVANPKDGPSTMIIMRDVSLTGLQREQRKSESVTKLQQWAYDRVLWKCSSHPRIMSVVESIVGHDVRAHHFMAINKPSDTGMLSSRHPLHQDQWYFPFAPSKHICCAWTALQKVNRQNGCLCVVPGTHKLVPSLQMGGKLLPHAYPKPWNGPVNKAYHGIQVDGEHTMNKVLRKRVHLEMEPGDTVFFHPLLFHASGANLTDTNRRSISTHYCNSMRVQFVEGGVIPEQQKIAKEVELMAKRLHGVTVSYPTIWKMKSRQVKGNAGCFK